MAFRDGLAGTVGFGGLTRGACPAFGSPLAVATAPPATAPSAASPPPPRSVFAIPFAFSGAFSGGRLPPGSEVVVIAGIVAIAGAVCPPGIIETVVEPLAAGGIVVGHRRTVAEGPIRLALGSGPVAFAALVSASAATASAATASPAAAAFSLLSFARPFPSGIATPDGVVIARFVTGHAAPNGWRQVTAAGLRFVPGTVMSRPLDAGAVEPRAVVAATAAGGGIVPAAIAIALPFVAPRRRLDRRPRRHVVGRLGTGSLRAGWPRGGFGGRNEPQFRGESTPVGAGGGGGRFVLTGGRRGAGRRHGRGGGPRRLGGGLGRGLRPERLGETGPRVGLLIVFGHRWFPAGRSICRRSGSGAHVSAPRATAARYYKPAWDGRRRSFAARSPAARSPAAWAAGRVSRPSGVSLSGSSGGLKASQGVGRRARERIMLPLSATSNSGR